VFSLRSLFRILFCIFINSISWFFLPLFSSEPSLVGELENGLKYYIQKNTFPNQTASLRLVVKVGSIYEEESERGLAHFIEHMVFRGSKHFQDWEVIRYLESIGAEFGPDTNAYTSFEETVYCLEIPLDKPDVLENGVLILSDFAGRANLEDAMINIERGVVCDEYHLFKSSSKSRFYESLFDKYVHDSPYANRFPIGLKNVILESDPSLLRQFYKKWYVPNRMAIIAVGDFDVALVEAYIKKWFSSFERGCDEILNPEVSFPKQSEALVYKDPDQSYLEMALWQFFESECPFQINEAYLKNSVNFLIFTSVLNQRLEKISKRKNAPFLAGFIAEENLTTYHKALKISGYAFKDNPLETISALASELFRLIKFGPTKMEMERERKRLLEELSDSEKNEGRIQNSSIANAYTMYFLCGFSSCSYKESIEIQRKYVEEVKIQNILDWAKKTISLEKMSEVFFLPEDVEIDQFKVKEVINSIEFDRIEQELEVLDQELEVNCNGYATLTSYSESETLGYSSMILNDKQRVVLYPTDIEKGRVLFKLVAKGGKTLFDETLYESSLLSPNYFINAGASNLDSEQFRNYLNKRSIGIDVKLFTNKREIYISGPSSEANEILKTLRALFFHKRHDENFLSNLVKFKKELDSQNKSSVQAILLSKIFSLFSENHPIFTNQENMDLLESDIENCTSLAFGDLESFDLIIVGDFQANELTSDIFYYLNPPKKEKIDIFIKKPEIPISASDVEEKFYMGKHTHGMMVLGFRKKFESKPPNEIQLRSLCLILQERIIQKLRKEEGGTYSPEINFIYPFNPDPTEICLFILLSAEPDKLTLMKEKLSEVLSDFLASPISEGDIVRVKEILHKDLKEKKLYLNFWVNFFSDAMLQNKNFEDYLDQIDRLEGLNVNELKALADSIMRDNSKYSLMMLPES
jgi:zinc protease